MGSDRLSRGEMMMLGAAVTLLVVSFLPLWATADFEPFPGIKGASESFNAWSQAFGVLLRLVLVLAVAAVALAVAKLFGLGLPVANPGSVYLLLTGAAFLLMLLVLLNGPELGNLPEAKARLAGINIGRGVLLFVATGLVGLMVLGAYLNAMEPSKAGRSRR